MAETQDITKSNRIPIGYKQTAVGVIPEEWEVKRFGDLCSIKGEYGINAAAVPFNSELPTYIRITDIDDYGYFITEKKMSVEHPESNKYVLESEDLLFARTGGTVGKSYLHKEQNGKLVFAGFLIRFRTDEKKLLARYFKNITETNKYWNWVKTASVRSGQPGLNADDYRKFQIPLPPLPEQRKIAEILSTWDEAITLTKTTIEELKLRNKGLAQQLLTGKKRLKGFSGEWKHLMIGQIAKPLNLTNKKNDDIEVLSCTKYDGLVPSLEYFGRQVFGADLSKYKIVPNGAFAYATNHIEEGSIGYQNLIDRGLVSPMYTVFSTKSGIEDEFLFKLLKSEKLIYSYQSNMSGSINRRGGLRWGDFSKIKIEIPGYKEQKEIAEVLNEAKNELNIQQQKLASLQEQKKGLMQKLLTGEVRVKID